MSQTPLHTLPTVIARSEATRRSEDNSTARDGHGRSLPRTPIRGPRDDSFESSHLSYRIC